MLIYGRTPKDYMKIIKEILDFWPMTIVVPAMLIAILFGAYLGL